MSRQRVAITGIRGQLGSAIERLNQARWEISGVGSDAVDIRDWRQVRDWVAFCRPQLVIHAAANTDVDGCERDPNGAFETNALGTRHVAQAAKAVGAKLVYVSTNFVFDGGSQRPYLEFDDPHPISVYGASKLAGEREALGAGTDVFIVRTAMVYAAHGRNFVNSMIRLFSERDELAVVDDQYGNPTFADDLAAGITNLVEFGPPGTYHMTNRGSASWFEWADEIREITKADTRLNRISGAEFRRDARPPDNGRLDSLALPALGIELPDWRDALRRCLRK